MKKPDSSICTAVHVMEIMNDTSWLGAATADACSTWGGGRKGGVHVSVSVF